MKDHNLMSHHTYLRNAAGNEVWSYGSVKGIFLSYRLGGGIKNLYNLSYETRFSNLKTKLSLGLVDQEKTGM